MGALVPATTKRRPVGGWPATVPKAMPAGAPTTAAATKEPAGPARALTPAATKGGPIRGWERAAAVAPAVVPAAATAPTTRSQEAAAVA
jgi:hypothetical protein